MQVRNEDFSSKIKKIKKVLDFFKKLKYNTNIATKFLLCMKERVQKNKQFFKEP